MLWTMSRRCPGWPVASPTSSRFANVSHAPDRPRRAARFSPSQNSKIGAIPMRMEDMILVSVDDHVVEPPSMHDFFVDHLPARYKERAPKVIRRPNGTDAWLIEGQEVANFGLNAVAGRIPEEWGYDPATFEQVRPGTYDVHERVRDMDVNGVLAGLNVPSWPGLGGQFFAQNDDVDCVAAMIRAYNDWTIHEWAG